MKLFLFWVKIAIKRILSLFIDSPVTIIWVMIIIASFTYAFATRHIVITRDILIITVLFLVIISLVKSLKEYNMMPFLIQYSKSKIHNKNIYFMFFIKQTFLNNILLIFFNIIALKFINNKKYITIMLTATVIFLTLSFLLMFLKNNFRIKKTNYKEIKRIKINPLIKSALYDYLSSDFVISSLFCIIIFIAFIINIAKDINNIYELKNTSAIFIMITIIFSVGFSGIIGSIPNINWKFQAIISPNNVKYHLKRTFLILAVFFGWLILLFVIFGSYINITLTIKYLYCIFMVLFTTVNISFSIANVIIKIFIITINTLLTVWISTLSIGFLPILLIPVIITFIKAKNEYREWSLL
ncbi:hypothetical protein R84B8_03046 [Treponema sp. R8-4-B8]